ncbi:glycosyltransferase [Flagellimonas pelagia]|uniref:Glycosyl transferase family 1 n=1 Tax=Flagellimonas pelagia TaxID=2306998 RepID=A0A3A1NJE3_9FLAO|nr:glycosyltransferase [Allomuricauda maritima]RIV45912.1 glycosyl transferase family 1 [Allomuricauda maritima]TXJ98673.1 glycosyltransferase family 4 protein [Allomuricauda maritima]
MQRILVIAYYWPPAGGPGVQRWLKFVKYLPEFGYEPLIYVPENPSYPITDRNLEKEIPTTVQILKQPIKEPYGWAALLSKKKTKTISSGIIQDKNPSLAERILLWIRGNFFIPDARKGWVKPSIHFLAKVIADEGIQTIVTTGPPHSLHLIGLGLKRKYDIHWIADFRDPWTSIGYHKKLRLMSWAAKKHESLEKEVLVSADKIIVTSQTTRREFEAITPKPIKVITNGFDEHLAPKELDQDFTISHLGSLLTGRNPLGLWQAIKELIAENETFQKALKIKLAGVISEEVQKSLQSFGLDTFVQQLGYLPHDQVTEIMQSSQVLLLLEIDSEETKGIIPGKLFEYLNAKRPILAIGPKDWEAGSMVKELEAGKFLQHSDVSSLKNVLLDWFNQYQEGKLECHSVGIEQYHRRALTESLAKFI